MAQSWCGESGEDHLERGRRVALLVILLAATVGFVVFVGRFYPIHEWLFWRYAGYWALTLVWGVTCLGVGHVLVVRCLGRPLPLLEQLSVALAAGLFAFELAVFLVGLVDGLVWPLFFLLPLLFGLVGLRPMWRFVRAHARHLAARRRALLPLPLWLWPVVGVGLLGLLLLYLAALNPNNIQFDARWKHLGMAEEYVAWGGVTRMAEGRVYAARPHMASFAYAWAFLLPGARLFDQVALCCHLEFLVFLLTTLCGTGALVRRLVPRAPPGLVWVMRLLFPGVYLYDSSLAAGVDHIGALYCVPLFVLAWRAYRRPRLGLAVLLGAMLAATALVKYTTALMMVPGVAVLVGLGVLRALRRGDGVRVWLWPQVGLAASALLCTAPFWLKNLVWYHNPVYPLLSQVFASVPWTADAAYMLKHGYQEYQFWRPAPGLAGVRETLGALFDFSFFPNDWPSFHGDVPVFGSLFTLLCLCLPFLRKTGRIWWLLGVTWVAIVIWYWVHHQDRYLQSLMPWLSAVAAAIFILVWRTRFRPVQVALVALVAAQVVWGGDVYFLPTHAMLNDAPIRDTARLLARGYAKDYDARLLVAPATEAMAKLLPADALVLVHEEHDSLGLRARKVEDFPTSQYGISYGLLRTPQAVQQALAALGVTHLVWRPTLSRSFDSLAGDLLFRWFAYRYATTETEQGGLRLARMPEAPVPAAAFNDRVLIADCGHGYASGVYQIDSLTVPSFGPARSRWPQPSLPLRESDDAHALLAQVDIAVVDPACAAHTWRGRYDASALAAAGFSKVFGRSTLAGIGNPAYDAYFRR